MLSRDNDVYYDQSYHMHFIFHSCFQVIYVVHNFDSVLSHTVPRIQTNLDVKIALPHSWAFLQIVFTHIIMP